MQRSSIIATVSWSWTRSPCLLSFARAWRRRYRWFVPGNAIETARASSLLSTYLSDERCGHRERAVRDLQWKCGQPPRRRPEHDLRALARVEFRVVTRTLEDVLVAAFGFHPFRDGTPGMRANRRIGDDAAGRARAGVLIELARIEPDDHDLVQSRALADDRGFRVLRPGMDG